MRCKFLSFVFSSVRNAYVDAHVSCNYLVHTEVAQCGGDHNPNIGRRMNVVTDGTFLELIIASYRRPIDRDGHVDHTVNRSDPMAHGYEELRDPLPNGMAGHSCKNHMKYHKSQEKAHPHVDKSRHVYVCPWRWRVLVCIFPRERWT